MISMITAVWASSFLHDKFAGKFVLTIWQGWNIHKEFYNL